MFQDSCDLSLSIMQFHVKHDTEAALTGVTSHTGDDKAFMDMHPNLMTRAAEGANGERLTVPQSLRIIHPRLLAQWEFTLHAAGV